MKKVSVVLLILMLFGCTPTDMEILEEDYAYRDSFTVEKNYQQVYRETLNRSQVCFPKFFIQEHLYTDKQSGTIEVMEITGNDILIAVEISAIDANRTNVIVYSEESALNKEAKAIKHWLISGSEKCKSDN